MAWGQPFPFRHSWFFVPKTKVCIFKKRENVNGGQRMKVILHVDSEKVRRLKLAMTNMKNLISAAEGRLVEGVIVVNGPAVQQVTQSMDMEVSQVVTRLTSAGVDFYVCARALAAHGIEKEMLHPDFKVTRAGILKLVELQKEGYAYIKP